MGRPIVNEFILCFYSFFSRQQNNRLNNRPREAEIDTRAWEKQAPPDMELESELFSGMNSGINFDKYEEIPVEATGKDCPTPISHFADLKLHPWIEENIKKSGYDRPTPVQVSKKLLCYSSLT